MSDAQNMTATPEAADTAAIDRLAQRQTEARYFEDLASFGWSTIGGQIILAGATFPIVFMLFVNSIAFIASVLTGRLLQLLNPIAAIGAVVSLLVVGVIGGFIGLVWSGLATLITLPVIQLAIWTMNIRADWIRLGAFSGGLVAFIATLPFSMQLPAAFNSRGANGLASVVVFLVPGLATIVGQYGGYRGGCRAIHMREGKNASRRALIAIGASRFGLDEVASVDEIESDRFQFRISHLLWLGLWVSLLFTVIRLSGLPYDLMLPVLFAWLIYQAATLYLGVMIGRYVLPRWRAWRQSRST